MTSLAHARNLILLCEITDEDSYKDIFKIFSSLQEQGYQVRLVGYVDEKEVPYFCLPQLTAEYFAKKDLSWFGAPTTMRIQDVIKEECDMLIDFNYRYHPAIQAFLSLTHAKFVVGRLKKNQELVDLLIDAEKLSNNDFLKNVGIYTKKLMGNDK